MTGLSVITFGCRLNAFESEVIRGAADAAGLDEAGIVNTCAVTAEAERQARQAIKGGAGGPGGGRGGAGRASDCGWRRDGVRRAPGAPTLGRPRRGRSRARQRREAA